jgi:hypothetical protein
MPLNRESRGTAGDLLRRGANVTVAALVVTALCTSLRAAPATAAGTSAHRPASAGFPLSAANVAGVAMIVVAAAALAVVLSWQRRAAAAGRRRVAPARAQKLRARKRPGRSATTGDRRLRLVRAEAAAAGREDTAPLRASGEEILQHPGAETLRVAGPAGSEAGEPMRTGYLRLAKRVLGEAVEEAANIRSRASADAATTLAAAERQAAEIGATHDAAERQAGEINLRARATLAAAQRDAVAIRRQATATLIAAEQRAAEVTQYASAALAAAERDAGELRTSGRHVREDRHRAEGPSTTPAPRLRPSQQPGPGSMPRSA